MKQYTKSTWLDECCYNVHSVTLSSMADISFQKSTKTSFIFRKQHQKYPILSTACYSFIRQKATFLQTFLTSLKLQQRPGCLKFRDVFEGGGLSQELRLFDAKFLFISSKQHTFFRCCCITQRLPRKL